MGDPFMASGQAWRSNVFVAALADFGPSVVCSSEACTSWARCADQAEITHNKKIHSIVLGKNGTRFAALETHTRIASC